MTIRPQPIRPRSATFWAQNVANPGLEPGVSYENGHFCSRERRKPSEGRLPPRPRQKFTPVLFLSQGRRSAAERRVPPTTPRSCRRVPPAAWPASPGGGAGWAHRYTPVQATRNQSHRGIGRQAGVTTPVKQVPLSPSCQCHYPSQASVTIGKLKRILSPKIPMPSFHVVSGWDFLPGE